MHPIQLVHRLNRTRYFKIKFDQFLGVQNSFVFSHIQTLSENSHDEDDYVTIGHLTEYKIVNWRFPNTNICPRIFCSKPFENRAEAKQHYIKKHADYDMSCQECGVLIALSGAHNLLNHYNRKHPNIDPPPKEFENNVMKQIELFL